MIPGHNFILQMKKLRLSKEMVIGIKIAQHLEASSALRSVFPGEVCLIDGAGGAPPNDLAIVGLLMKLCSY